MLAHLILYIQWNLFLGMFNSLIKWKVCVSELWYSCKCTVSSICVCLYLVLYQYLCTSFHVMYYYIILLSSALSLLFLFLVFSPVVSLCFRFFSVSQWQLFKKNWFDSYMRVYACTVYIIWHNLHTAWCMIFASILLSNDSSQCCGTCIECISSRYAHSNFSSLRFAFWVQHELHNIVAFNLIRVIIFRFVQNVDNILLVRLTVSTE